MKNEIDYAPATHELDDVLFKVKLQAIHSDFLFTSPLSIQSVLANNYRAVVNQSNGHIISVVGNQYNLVPNEKAIEMGKDIFTQLYPEVNACDLIPYKVVAPLSKASAHIDLIHKDVNFNVWEQEKWLPFLRTTNSYNRSYALSFEIGFVRKLCSNGVLFNKESMKLKYLHSKKNCAEMKKDTAKLKATSDLFSEQCCRLSDFRFFPELMVPLVFKVLNINLELPEKRHQIKKKVNNLQNLIELTKAITGRYFFELGNNAYAAFNVITDLISHQDEYKNFTGYYLSVRSFYTKSAEWMDEFLAEISDKTFVFPNYLKETIVNIESLTMLTELEWELN